MRDDFTQFSRIYQCFQTLTHPALMQRRQFYRSNDASLCSKGKKVKINTF
ncbi:MAG: hypothetical protein HRU34_01125 [Richelia sp.]|nr:hypothetical protein [Richelia sp.]CDN10292.1 hypothetical protein RintRC_1414 [Richelia intracellularis]